MGSTFTTFSGQKVKGFMGKEYSVPVYLQFVPGYCVDAVHSVESNGYKGPSTINSIYAVSHVPLTTGKRRQQTYSEDNRYFPLLRNHGDIPTKGDPVLLCTIGKINYYLGPLNTINNSPTWNDDLNFKKELTMANNDIQKNTPRGERGESLNFNKEALYSRLQKIRNQDLDYGTTLNEVTGDYMIEGRHGNSIRIGSRSNNPYIFISNQRNNLNIFETLGDGGLISITSNGTLAQHFKPYFEGEANDESSEPVIGYKLPSDAEGNNFTIANIQSKTNNNVDSQQSIYGYSRNQMLLHSDRITLSSRLDDIFISSFKDIHIGSNENLTVSAKNEIILSSTKTKLGFNANQPMVKGNELLDLLTSIVDMFSEVKVLTMLGTQPLIPSPNLAKVTTNLNKFISSKHFIDE